MKKKVILTVVLALIAIGILGFFGETILSKYRGYCLRSSRTEYFWYPTKVLIKRTDAIVPDGFGSISVAYFVYSDGSSERVYGTNRKKFPLQVGDRLGRFASKYFLIITKIDVGEQKISFTLDDGSMQTFDKMDSLFEEKKSLHVGDTLFITEY